MARCVGDFFAISGDGMMQGSQLNRGLSDGSDDGVARVREERRDQAAST